MFLAYAFYSWAHSSVNISYCQFLWHRCWLLRRQCRMFKCHGAVRLFYVHLVFSFAGKSSILVCTGHWWNVLRFIMQSDSNSLLYGVRQLNWSLFCSCCQCLTVYLWLLNIDILCVFVSIMIAVVAVWYWVIKLIYCQDAKQRVEWVSAINNHASDKALIQGIALSWVFKGWFTRMACCQLISIGSWKLLLSMSDSTSFEL